MYEETREKLIEISGQDLDGPPPLGPSVTYHIKCHGRDCEGNETLDFLVPAEVTVYQNPMRSVISVDVECKYIAGSHHYRCMASHPEEEDHDRHGHKIDCPYVISLGHVEGKWKEPVGVHRNY
jgi:hypothetical protein